MTTPRHSVFELADKAQAMFLAGDAEGALSACETALGEFNHVRLWRLKARLLVFFGREEEASQILNARLLEGAAPGFWEIAQARLPFSYALVDSVRELAYFPVRKCSSTSLHNAMRIIAGGEASGEKVHEGLKIYSLLPHSELQSVYRNFFKFLIVRDPIERVRSFFHGNIAKRNHLVLDTEGKESFHGLSTKPSYDEFLDQFEAYRRTFITVRNHTDPLVGFAGMNAGLYDWIGGVEQTQELLGLLEEKTGVELPAISEMRSGAKAEPLSAKEQALQEFYKVDYDTYGPWL